MHTYTIDELRKGGMIVFECLTGSQAYGTATPASDEDIKGVFVQPWDDVLKHGFVKQVSDEKHDVTFFEIGRFFELLITNNPTVIEMLGTPDDCIIFKSNYFSDVIDEKDKFITKACRRTFGEYAVQQIKKARGLNKKIVRPMEDKRKTVLDFCFVVHDQGSIPVKQFLAKRGISQEMIGLVAISNMQYYYGAFLTVVPGHYRGIVTNEEKSNEICLSSIEKGKKPLFHLHFNKDGYSSHCKDFKEYEDWKKNRNKARFSDNMLHGKGYDGKNLAHCHRLLDMAIEIGEGKGVIVRRPDREFLLDVRKGEYEYDDLVKSAEGKIDKMREIYKDSKLPDEIDVDQALELLHDVRKIIYAL